MKNYKDYNKTYIGSSDSAYLTLKTITGTTEELYFGEDGSYSAYVVDEDTLIPKHYHKEFEFTDSLEIYNDFGELELMRTVCSTSQIAVKNTEAR